MQPAERPRRPHPHAGYGYLTTPLRSMLSDGEWHDLNMLTAELMHLIKPELAVRRYRRIGGTNSKSGPPRGTLEHQLMQGSRYIIWDCLRRIPNMQKRGDRESGFQFRLPLIHAKAS